MSLLSSVDEYLKSKNEENQNVFNKILQKTEIAAKTAGITDREKIFEIAANDYGKFLQKINEENEQTFERATKFLNQKRKIAEKDEEESDEGEEEVTKKKKTFKDRNRSLNPDS